MSEPDWMADALCAQVDHELFFPEIGGTTHPAKSICKGCDVREACLQYALDNHEAFGIWGGLSDRQRRKLQPSPGCLFRGGVVDRTGPGGRTSARYCSTDCRESARRARERGAA